MKRGAYLEYKLNAVHREYREAGRACVFKTHPPATLEKGKLVYYEKAPPDYAGCVNGLPVMFDAKETSKLSFPFANLKRHQAEWLQDHMDAGGLSFLVIRFIKKRLYVYVDWSDICHEWFRWSDEGGRPASVRYDDPRMRKIKGADWLPALEVK